MISRVGFTGPAGSGKTTMAQNLAEFYGGKRLSFATALRTEYATLHNIPAAHLTTIPIKYKHRAGLQDYGSQKRAADPDYWIRPVEEQLQRWQRLGYRNLYVDDVRLEAEAALLRRHGFEIVLTEGPASPANSAALPAATATHITEQEWRTIQPNYCLDWIAPANAADVKRVVYLRLAELYMYLDSETLAWNVAHSRQ